MKNIPVQQNPSWRPTAGQNGPGDYGYKGLWVQEIMGTRDYGYKGLWVQGIMGIRDYGYKGLWVQGIMGTRDYGYKIGCGQKNDLKTIKGTQDFFQFSINA